MLIRLFALLFLISTPGLFGASAPSTPIYLTKLLIADTEAKASSLPVDSGGANPIFVQDVPVLAEPAFAASLGKYVGALITSDLVNALANGIAQYARDHDRLIIKVIPPDQDITAGVLRLCVVVGRYNEFQFKGNRWFSSKLLQEKLGIKSGDEVRISTLEEAVNWANANPFRQIKVLINDLANQPGKADLIIGVEERIPLRLTTSYDNYGNTYLGHNHYTAAVQFGNLWGRDHQGSYQFTTTDDTKVFRSHAFDYRVPLPWRHYLQFSGGYLKVQPTFGAGGVFKQDGQNLNASVRYVYPIRGGDSPIEFTTGIDFKQGDNTLAYNNVVQQTGTTDTIQLATGISMVKRDRRGAWVFGANVNASPGNLNERNTNDAFSSRDKNKAFYPYNGRKSITATYVTGTLSIQRLLNLEHDWSLFSRAMGQFASGSLPGSEQLSIGGAATVRGFDERIYSGDRGFVFSNDLQSPAWKKTLPFLKKRPPLETRFVAFYDAAQVFYKFADVNDINLTPLASTGLGVRMSLPINFTLSADYGWQVTHFSRKPIPGVLDYKSPSHSGGHIKVVLAF